MEIWKSEKKMGGNVRSFLYHSKHRWVASIIALAFSPIGCLIPCHAFCSVGEAQSLQVLDSPDSLQTDKLEKNFDALEKSISKSANSLIESEKLLNDFLKEVESHYGIKLTIQEACQIVKENLDHFQLPDVAKASLLIAIQFFSEERTNKGSSQVINIPDPSAQTLFITPGLIAAWNYFSKEKPQKNKHKKKSYSQTASLSLVEDPEVELPGNIIVGAVEIFAGILICILPHPVTFRIGMGMIADGSRRVVDGYIQADDEERLRRTFPASP